MKYNWERIIGGGSSDDIKCSNKKNTCERALCECDLDYAKKVISVGSIILGQNSLGFE